MLHKTFLSLVAGLLAIAALGAAPAQPAEAFGEAPFIQVWNANVGVVDRAVERFLANPSDRQMIRVLREIARAENRIMTWLRQRPATACQAPFKKQIISRGTVAMKSFKAAARDVKERAYRRATIRMDRGFRFHEGMFNAGVNMVQTCR
jgi:hypothetical protein